MASKSALQLAAGHVDADVGVDAELGAFESHLLEAAIEVLLLHLELGNAVAKQPADAIGALEDHDVVPGACQLLRGGETRRPRADHRDALARRSPWPARA